MPPQVLPPLIVIINLVKVQQPRVAQALLMKLVPVELVVLAGVHAKLNIPRDL